MQSARNRDPACSTIDPTFRARARAPGVAKVFKLSSNETPLGPSANAIAAYRAVGEHLEDYPDGSASALARSNRRAPSGSIPIASSAAPAPTICSICSRAPICSDGDEAIHTTHGFLVYPIATHGHRAQKPVAAPERISPLNVDAILDAVTPNAPKWCSSPTRTIRPGPMCPFDEVKRLHNGSAGACAARARRRLRRICAAQRLRVRHRAGRHHRQRGDDAAPSRRFTGSPRCGSAGCTGPRMWSTRSTASAGRSTSTRRRSPQASRRSRDTAHVERARAHNDALARLAHGGNRQARARR